MAFKQGISGNVGGRPKGSGHRQLLFNMLVEPHKDALFAKAINLALSGNEAMLKLFLERMLPSRPSDDTIDIHIAHDLKRADGLLVYGETVLFGISEGQLTPQQAKAIMSTIEMQRKNVETCEIVERVGAIERILKQRKLKEKTNA